jgi:hypothetical protein
MTEPSNKLLPDTFELPPIVHTARGEVRKAGFEFEYAGLSLDDACGIIQSIFGGEHVVHSTFAHEVKDTSLGDYSVEIDSSVLKDKRYEQALRAIGVNVDSIDTRPLEQVLSGMFTTIVPFEIGTPPVPITLLNALEELRRKLHENSAQGTRASLLYAFGLHINPEIVNDDPLMLRDVLRAFVLLYPWLKESAEVDIARSITPFIKPFPVDYARLILPADYAPTRDQLIGDYLKHNPTRNRPLDMLPILAHLNRERVAGQAPDMRLVKPRPAYHYRLPNCMVDEPGWTLAREWNAWVQVERLAHDADRLADMSRDFLAADDQSLRPFYDKWPERVKERMSSEAR